MKQEGLWGSGETQSPATRISTPNHLLCCISRDLLNSSVRVRGTSISDKPVSKIRHREQWRYKACDYSRSLRASCSVFNPPNLPTKSRSCATVLACKRACVLYGTVFIVLRIARSLCSPRQSDVQHDSVVYRRRRNSNLAILRIMDPSPWIRYVSSSSHL